MHTPKWSLLLRGTHRHEEHASYCNVPSTVGIHKDDLVFEIEGYPIKKFGMLNDNYDGYLVDNNVYVNNGLLFLENRGH